MKRYSRGIRGRSSKFTYSEFSDNSKANPGIIRFTQYGVFVALLLTLAGTVWVPENPEYQYMVILLGGLTFLGLILIAIDKANRGVDLLITQRSDNAILLTVAGFVGAFFIARSISASLITGDVSNVANMPIPGSMVLSVGMLASAVGGLTIGTIIATQLNVFAESIIFQALPAGIGRWLGQRAGWRFALMGASVLLITLFFQFLFVWIFAPSFHALSHDLFTNIWNFRYSLIIFSMFQLILLATKDIRPAAGAHHGWNYGVVSDLVFTVATPVTGAVILMLLLIPNYYSIKFLIKSFNKGF